MDRETFTITIEPTGDGRLKVTIPEIQATVETQGDTLNEAIDAAHRAIGAYLYQRQLAAARAS
jgi:predicted RNase H-like HicB family nuclease